MIKRLSTLHKASLILCGVLVIALCPLPYGFYTLIRLSTSIIAACWAVRFLEQERTALAITFGGIALLFQPVIKITLDKFTWSIIDILLAVFLVVTVIKDRPSEA